MPTCASVGAVAAPSGGQSLAFTPSACASDSYVISSAVEFSQAQQDTATLVARVAALEDAASSPPMPSAADVATAWGIGLTSVVGCYVIARAAGAVVNFIK